MSTLCPPDVIHIIGVPRPSLIFLRSSASVYYTENKPNKKRRRPGNEARFHLQPFVGTVLCGNRASLDA